MPGAPAAAASRPPGAAGRPASGRSSRAWGSGRGRHGGRGRRRRVLLAQHPQHPAHLLERVPAGGLDRAEGVARVGGAAVDDVLPVAGLHGDDAHAVRHDVVQFPGDPQPLFGHGAARRLFLQHLGVQPPLPHRVAGYPADDQGERGGDQQARGAAVAGDPVVGEHDEHHHDERQPQRGAAGPPVAGGCHQVEHVGGGQEHDPRGEALGGEQHGEDDEGAEGGDRGKAAQRHRHEDGHAEQQHGGHRDNAGTLPHQGHLGDRGQPSGHAVERDPVPAPHPLGQRRAGRPGSPPRPRVRVCRQRGRFTARVGRVAFGDHRPTVTADRRPCLIPGA